MQMSKELEPPLKARDIHPYLKLALVGVVFLVAFWLSPMRHLNFLELMPGDIGDARLNNYFLENIYQYFVGGSESLWQLGFFYPFPYVLGFSDNLFGSAPVYLLARSWVGEPDTAYQIWYLAAYVVNFAAAYYALKKLGGSALAATIGALIFAFALPTTAHAGHAQLHYRFGIPLAIAFLVRFYEQNSFRSLLVSLAWLVWQFYAGVYMGFFSLLLMVAMSVIYFRSWVPGDRRGHKAVIPRFKAAWQLLSVREKALSALLLGMLALALLVLFFPYLQVTYLYKVRRGWAEIASMLPRIQSYFLSDSSKLWALPEASIFAGLPMRHEHQMFMGAVPLLLALGGFLAGRRGRPGLTYGLMVGMLVLSVLLTINVGGVSLWFFFHFLPLASAIRAMTRLDQALLFPVAYFAVVAIDYLRHRFSWGLKAAVGLIIPLLILEFSLTTMGSSSKLAWRQRMQAVEALAPTNLPKDAVLFVAQRGGPHFADELDVMWLSLRLGVKTLNGYSGLYPPGFKGEFGQHCAELPSRLHAYLKFIGNDNPKRYQELFDRVTPAGFYNCDSQWH